MQRKMKKRSIIVFVVLLMLAAIIPVAGFGKTVSADTVVKRVLSAKAKINMLPKGSAQEFEVVTTTDVKYLMLYAEDGNTLVQTWTAGGTSVSGNTRTWTVRQVINTPGARKLIFKGGVGGFTPVTNAMTCVFAVVDTRVISGSAKYASIKKGGEQIFTIKTTSDAKYLMEYSEDGYLVKTWTPSSANSVISGAERIWTVSQNIATAGKRSLVFKAGLSSTPTSAKITINFTVESTWVNEATVKNATIDKGATQTFTVKTPTNAQYLMLYAEGGNLVKTWPASGNSKVSGDVRTWTVNLAINTGGNRTLTLKAGTTTTPSSLGKTVKFLVAEKKIVSAKAANSAIKKGGAQQFTVVTSIDVKYLMLYAEDGKNLVASWDSSYSTEDSSKTRTWKVSRNIATAGDRKLVFKGGRTGTTAVTNALTVSFKVEDTWVNSVSVGYWNVGTGGTQTFKVSTTKNAQYLMLYAEGGNLVKTWPAAGNSSVSGDSRIWNVNLAINTAGSRKLTLKAGKTTTASSFGKTAEFNVLSKSLVSAVAKYPDITKTMEDEFTVLTSADVKYLFVYINNSKTPDASWGAAGNSTVDSANMRTWKVKLKLSVAGSCSFAFEGGVTANRPETSSNVGCGVRVRDYGIISVAAEYSSVKIGQKQQFTVKTTTNDNTLDLFSYYGEKQYRWSATSQNTSDNGEIRTWNVSVAFDNAGDKEMTFRTHPDSTSPWSELSVSFKVTGEVVINSVTFPDKVFRDYVSEEFDTDKNGILNATEIDKARKIDLCYAELKSLVGVQYFTLLEQLYCGYNGMPELDVSKNTNLFRLDCYGNNLNSLNVTNNTKLTHLSCFGNQLTNLNVSNNTKLVSLNCSLNRLIALDVSKNTDLEYLSCDRNSLPSLNLNSNPKLYHLNCGDNQLDTLDVSHNSALLELYCYKNLISELNLKNNVKLNLLACHENQINELNVNNNRELVTLRCSFNNLGALDLSNNTELKNLYCENTNILKLDVSKNEKLNLLQCNTDVVITGAGDNVTITRKN